MKKFTEIREALTQQFQQAAAIGDQSRKNQMSTANARNKEADAKKKEAEARATNSKASMGEGVDHETTTAPSGETVHGHVGLDGRWNKVAFNNYMKKAGHSGMATVNPERGAGKNNAAVINLSTPEAIAHAKKFPGFLPINWNKKTNESYGDSLGEDMNHSSALEASKQRLKAHSDALDALEDKHGTQAARKLPEYKAREDKFHKEIDVHNSHLNAMREEFDLDEATSGNTRLVNRLKQHGFDTNATEKWAKDNLAKIKADQEEAKKRNAEADAAAAKRSAMFAEPMFKKEETELDEGNYENKASRRAKTIFRTVRKGGDTSKVDYLLKKESVEEETSGKHPYKMTYIKLHREGGPNGTAEIHHATIHTEAPIVSGDSPERIRYLIGKSPEHKAIKAKGYETHKMGEHYTSPTNDYYQKPIKYTGKKG